MKSSKSRLYNSIKNSFAGSLSQGLMIILGFVSQTIFIKTLGATYLGVKGLFTNILTVLSFTDLGIGTAFTFSFYKPLAEKDEQLIAQIMYLFKKIYEYVGIIIGIIGVAIIPSIHFFTHVHIRHLYIYYLLFLLNTVLSYFFTYKRTLLDADQLSYINYVNQLIFKIIQIGLQCIVLLIFKSFILFLVIQIITNLLSNIIISINVDKKYSFLNQKEYLKTKLSNSKIKEIISHAFGTIGQKIGTIIVNNTDNMLISYFMGLATVGIYSNYVLITSSLSGVISKGVQSIASSIGNLNIEKKEDKDYQYKILNRSMYVVFFCIFVISTCLMTLVNNFIRFWVGSRFEFSFIIVFLLVVNFTIMAFRSVFQTFITAYGLYVKDGKKAVVEAIFNFVFSLIYIKYCQMGVAGVILGTITSNVLVNWYEPYIILKYGIGIKEKFVPFIFKVCMYIGMVLFSMLVAWLVINKFIIVHSFIEFLIQAIVTLGISLVMFVIIMGHGKHFNFLLGTFLKILKR